MSRAAAGPLAALRRGTRPGMLPGVSEERPRAGFAREPGAPARIPAGLTGSRAMGRVPGAGPASSPRTRRQGGKS